jgi:hypothetical protein
VCRCVDDDCGNNDVVCNTLVKIRETHLSPSVKLSRVIKLGMVWSNIERGDLDGVIKYRVALHCVVSSCHEKVIISLQTKRTSTVKEQFDRAK